MGSLCGFSKYVGSVATLGNLGVSAGSEAKSRIVGASTVSMASRCQGTAYAQVALVIALLILIWLQMPEDLYSTLSAGNDSFICPNCLAGVHQCFTCGHYGRSKPLKDGSKPQELYR